MKKKIVFCVFIITFILIMIPSTSAVYLTFESKSKETVSIIEKDFPKDLNELSTKRTPLWFTYLYNLILNSLRARILFITPLALTVIDGYHERFEVNSYFLLFILITQIYRLIFWYNYLGRIAQKNNWELPE